MPDQSVSRRQFLTGLGMTTLAIPLSARTGLADGKRANDAPRSIEIGGGTSSSLLYPPFDLSYFDTPVSPAPSDIRYGYAAITWGGDDLQAIKDISSLGFPGIQLRANILRDFGTKPEALKELLGQNSLEFVALSSGGIKMTPGREQDEILLHAGNGKFLADAGGRYLQVTDAGRVKGKPPSPDDYKRLGNLLTEIGQRVTDLGVRLGYHNHMGTLGQSADEVGRIMDEADPKYVKLELDIAHYFQGGGDPVRAIRNYEDRLLFLHLKDVQRLSSAEGYQFVELGKGLVDVPAVVTALEQVRFRGWAVVELDSVPDQERKAGRTPKDCAIENKKFLEEHIGAKF